MSFPAPLPGETAVFFISPENITITTSDPGKSTGARNVFTATIGEIISMGVYCKLHLDCGFPWSPVSTRNPSARCMRRRETGIDSL